ncbi:hypothetical protein [Halorhabdus amylolytica]|uniref:hypothetical protein n=1 Tax=Halorhabdus amylolytica TaxID=2559573 RepID=UPI0010AA1E8C|nr:hypothetical protein [Halorhabdus amylolytica]
MSGSQPFVKRENDELDLRQIWDESLPILGLVVLFGSLALLPYLVVVVIFEGTFISLILRSFTQLVLAVGAAIVLMYVVTRAIQLADG